MFICRTAQAIVLAVAVLDNGSGVSGRIPRRWLMLDATVSSQSSYDRLTRALEWPMGLLALAVIPAILLDDGSETPRVHLLAMSVNWFVWLAFQCRVRAEVERVAAAVTSSSSGHGSRLSSSRYRRRLGVPAIVAGCAGTPGAQVCFDSFEPAAFLTIGMKTARRVLQHRKFHYVTSFAHSGGVARSARPPMSLSVPQKSVRHFVWRCGLAGDHDHHDRWIAATFCPGYG